MRLDDQLPHSSFRLDGKVYTILSMSNGMVHCESEDGGYVIFPGHLKIDLWEPRRFSWLRAALP